MWVKKMQDLTLRMYGSLFEDAFGMLPITQYGAVGDNTTDNYGELQTVINKSIENGYKYIFVPKGNYYYYGNLKNVDKVIFVGNSTKAKIYNQNDEKIRIEQIGLSTVSNLEFTYGILKIEDRQVTSDYGNFAVEIPEDIIISELYVKVGNNIIYATDTLNLCDGKLITADNCPILEEVKSDEETIGYVYLTGIRLENNAIRFYYETVGLTAENMPSLTLEFEYWLRGNGKYKEDTGLPPEPVPPLFTENDTEHNPMPDDEDDTDDASGNEDSNDGSSEENSGGGSTGTGESTSSGGGSSSSGSSGSGGSTPTAPDTGSGGTSSGGHNDLPDD